VLVLADFKGMPAMATVTKRDSVGLRTQKGQAPIVLDYKASRGKVLVKPANDDLFFMSVQRAAEACQMADKAYAFGSQFRALLNKLGTWIVAHRRQIGNAFVTVRDGGFLFLVIQKKAVLDMDFEKEMTDLDLAVCSDSTFSLLRLNVLALPACTAESQAAFLYADATWGFNAS
jgi:hypothetical protein